MHEAITLEEYHANVYLKFCKAGGFEISYVSNE